MIILRNGKLELMGLPITELSKPIEDREAGHHATSHLKERLKSGQFEVLKEIFHNPGIVREKVDNTQNTPVYRLIYNDENAEQVKAGWFRIKYV